jgi:hypothetical protein
MGTEAALKALKSRFMASMMPLTIFLTHSADFLAKRSAFLAETTFCAQKRHASLVPVLNFYVQTYTDSMTAIP